MFWTNFLCGVVTGITLKGCEKAVRYLLKSEGYHVKSLAKEAEEVGVAVEASLIFDQFVGRIYACDTGKSLVTEREAIFMMAEQFSNLEEKCSGEKKSSIIHFLDLLERFLSGEEDAVPLARSLRDGILDGSLRV